LYEVRITAVALDPFQLTVPVGAHVRFVNTGIFGHQIGSACPELENVGLLQPGESRDTGTFASARTCSYHDRLNPAQVLLQGTIIVR
jgi:plastocyanin